VRTISCGKRPKPSGSAFYQWVEYCIRRREAHVGDTRSAAVFLNRFAEILGVGDESLVAAGDFTPERGRVFDRLYVVLRRTRRAKLVASDPIPTEWSWTREFLKEVVRKGTGLGRIYRNGAAHYAELDPRKQTPGLETREKATRLKLKMWTGV